jgi:hypothetical protein
MHNNKLQSAELAEYAAQLTYEVHRAIQGQEGLVDGDLKLKTALEKLQTYASIILASLFRFTTDISI